MATTLILKKALGGLIPSSNADADELDTLKSGTDYKCVMSQPRNIGFHRKYFALLNFAYEHFEPTQVFYKGEQILKNRERFRHDIAILSGYYTTTLNINGEPRLDAKSISFAKMDEHEFEALYSKTIDVILAKVLNNYDDDELRNVVDELLGYS